MLSTTFHCMMCPAMDSGKTFRPEKRIREGSELKHLSSDIFEGLSYGKSKLCFSKKQFWG